MLKQLSVLIVEDDHLLRSGLELAIQSEEDMDVCATAQNGFEALAAIERSKPDIVLLDIQMPEMDGITCIKEIRRTNAQLPILILTTFNEEEYIFQGLANGANGYLLKNMNIQNLVQTIREAAANRYLLPVEVAAKVARYAMNNSSFMKEKKLTYFFEHDLLFTKVEQQIIALLMNKLSNKEIADKLHFTEGTVKNKLTIIYDKLGMPNRRDAIQKLEKLIYE